MLTYTIVGNMVKIDGSDFVDPVHARQQLASLKTDILECRKTYRTVLFMIDLRSGSV